MGLAPHRKAILAVLVLAVAASIAPARSSPADSSSEGGVFLVSVFDCYMPVPDNFVLDTQDKGGFVLFRNDPLVAMRIKISDYKSDLGSTFRRQDQRRVGKLTVEEYRNATREDIRITRIHDQKQQLVVYGATDELLESIVQGCASRKHGDLFSE